MQYAIVDGVRQTPNPNRSGVCPHCGAQVLSKCGEVKVWHWAHSRRRDCDPWWERETEWHRQWKDNFPTEWHEVGHRATTGERHVADVKTAYGLVLEFQHSALPALERRARTNFYGNIVWLVDGLRRKNDALRFGEHFHYWTKVGTEVLTAHFPEDGLPKEWLDCDAPVIFDFGQEKVRGTASAYNDHTLWCLFPRQWNSKRLLLPISKTEFISAVLGANPLPLWAELVAQLEAQRVKDELAHKQEGLEYRKRVRQYHYARRSGVRNW